ncbi:MAG: hypothetical protein M0006_15575 [Magnetospirillum sp.]|nr:hypothetical protein [Magnetospirillum sp.]
MAGRRIGAAAIMAWALGMPPAPAATLREAVLAPAGTVSGEQVDLTVEQAFYPNLPAKRSCRLEIYAVNRTGRHVGLHALISTRDGNSREVDSWLVPTGEMSPGAEVKRVYSCDKAASIEIMRTTPFGWPKTCNVDGTDVSPCPIALHVTSSLAFSDSK